MKLFVYGFILGKIVKVGKDLNKTLLKSKFSNFRTFKTKMNKELANKA